MKNKKTLLVMILIFVLLLFGAKLLYDKLGQDLAPDQLATQEPTVPAASGEAAPPEKVQAPDFTVFDRDGGEVHLSDFFGKPIVVNFWASWCGPCQMEMPDFQEAYLQQGDEIHFLMVNMTDGGRETVETALAFIEDAGYTFPVYFDQNLDAANTYGAYSLPTTFFIDAEGYAVAQATGAINAATLQRGIDMITE